jgi:hypothetical protein
LLYFIKRNLGGQLPETVCHLPPLSISHDRFSQRAIPSPCQIPRIDDLSRRGRALARKLKIDGKMFAEKVGKT